MRLANREPSKYQTAVEAKVPERFLASFFDILMAFILTVCLFSLFDLALTHMSVYKDQASISESYQEELYSLVEDSHLSKREDSQLESVEDTARNYLLSLTLKTLKEVKPAEEISSSTYSEVEPITPETDALYYYNAIFKNENRDKYNDAEFYDADSYLNMFLTSDIKEYFTVEGGYAYLAEDVALDLDEYLVNNSDVGEEIYMSIYNRYSSLLNDAITEFTGSYRPYVEMNEKFIESSHSQLNMHGIALLLSYLLSLIILFIVMPLIFKDGKTISMRVLSLATSDVRGYETSLLNLIFRFFFYFLADGFIPFISVLLAFGYEGTFFMQINIMSFFNLFTFFIISLVYLLATSIVSLIPRKNGRQSLTDILSLLYLKDTKEYRKDEVIHFENKRERS